MARFIAKTETLTLQRRGTTETQTFSRGEEVTADFLPIGRSHIQLMIDAGQIEQVTKPKPMKGVAYVSSTMARIHAGFFRRR